MLRDKEIIRTELIAAETEMHRCGDLLDETGSDEARYNYKRALAAYYLLRDEFRMVLAGTPRKRP